MSAGENSVSELTIGFMDYTDCRVVSIAGRVDHTNAARFLETLSGHAGELGGGGMVADLTELEFITSAGLRALLMAHRRMADAGGRMVVAGLGGVVKEVFRISKFDALLDVADNVGEAVGRISPSAREASPG